MKCFCRPVILTLAMLCSACSGSETDDTGDVGSEDVEARHKIYCEVLLGYRDGTQIRLDVWNTWGLNDCPEEKWNAMDTDQVAEENGAVVALLNGPRYWSLDNFVESALVDDTVKIIGGLEMRKPAEVFKNPSELSTENTPYSQTSVARETTYLYDTGKMVHELVDPDGKVWVMQTYNGEQGVKTDEELKSQGEQLTLPEGWTSRSRTLTEDLYVRSNGLAFIVRDSADSTYQLSQQ